MFRKSFFFHGMMLLIVLPTMAEDSTRTQVLAQVACPTDVGDRFFRVVQDSKDMTNEVGAEGRLVIFRIERFLELTAETKEIIWQGETTYYHSVLPWPLWRAHLVCDQGSELLYFVLMYNRGVIRMVLDFFVFQTNEKAIEVKAPALTVSTPRTPRLNSKSVVHYVGEFPLESGGLKAIEATLADGHFEVVTAFFSERVAPIRFDIDLETKEIRRLPEAPSAPGETLP